MTEAFPNNPHFTSNDALRNPVLLTPEVAAGYREQLIDGVVKQSVGTVGVNTQFDLTPDQKGAMVNALSARGEPLKPDSIKAIQDDTSGIKSLGEEDPVRTSARGGWSRREYTYGDNKPDDRNNAELLTIYDADPADPAGMAEVTYFLDGSRLDSGTYRDDSGRSRVLTVGFRLPQKMADEFVNGVRQDPTLAADVIAAQLAAIGLDPGVRDTLRPSYTQPGNDTQGRSLSLAKGSGASSQPLVPESISYDNVTQVTPSENESGLKPHDPEALRKAHDTLTPAHQEADKDRARVVVPNYDSLLSDDQALAETEAHLGEEAVSITIRQGEGSAPSTDGETVREGNGDEMLLTREEVKSICSRWQWDPESERVVPKYAADFTNPLYHTLVEKLMDPSAYDGDPEINSILDEKRRTFEQAKTDRVSSLTAQASERLKNRSTHVQEAIQRQHDASLKMIMGEVWHPDGETLEHITEVLMQRERQLVEYMIEREIGLNARPETLPYNLSASEESIAVAASWTNFIVDGKSPFDYPPNIKKGEELIPLDDDTFSIPTLRTGIHEADAAIMAQMGVKNLHAVTRSMLRDAGVFFVNTIGEAEQPYFGAPITDEQGTLEVQKRVLLTKPELDRVYAAQKRSGVADLKGHDIKDVMTDMVMFCINPSNRLQGKRYLGGQGREGKNGLPRSPFVSSGKIYASGLGIMVRGEGGEASLRINSASIGLSGANEDYPGLSETCVPGETAWDQRYMSVREFIDRFYLPPPTRQEAFYAISHNIPTSRARAWLTRAATY